MKTHLTLLAVCFRTFSQTAEILFRLSQNHFEICSKSCSAYLGMAKYRHEFYNKVKPPNSGQCWDRIIRPLLRGVP